MIILHRICSNLIYYFINLKLSLERCNLLSASLLNPGAIPSNAINVSSKIMTETEVQWTDGYWVTMETGHWFADVSLSITCCVMLSFRGWMDVNFWKYCLSMEMVHQMEDKLMVMKKRLYLNSPCGQFPAIQHSDWVFFFTVCSNYTRHLQWATLPHHHHHTSTTLFGVSPLILSFCSPDTFTDS